MDSHWTAQVIDTATKVAVSYVLAWPVAWDRERASHTAGLRTFPLVATAATAYVLIAVDSFRGDGTAQARVVEGLITGMGFIGGGAILRQRNAVHGTATAAALWSTAAMGAATGYGLYHIAVLLSLVNFMTLKLLRPLKRQSTEDAPGRPD